MEERIIYMKDRDFFKNRFSSDYSFFIKTNATKEQVERLVVLATAIFNNEIDIEKFTSTEIEIFKKLNKYYDNDLSSIIVRVFNAYGYSYKEIEIESVYW